MTFWNWFFGCDATSSNFQAGVVPMVACDINPSTGLPIRNGCGAIDVAGNPNGAGLSFQAGRCLKASDFGVDSFFGFDTD